MAGNRNFTLDQIFQPLNVGFYQMYFPVFDDPNKEIIFDELRTDPKKTIYDFFRVYDVLVYDKNIDASESLGVIVLGIHNNGYCAGIKVQDQEGMSVDLTLEKEKEIEKLIAMAKNNPR